MAAFYSSLHPRRQGWNADAEALRRSGNLNKTQADTVYAAYTNRWQELGRAWQSDWRENAQDRKWDGLKGAHR